ncbi:DsbA family protein [Pseudomonas straminea]|uniref:DSBA-like thioredoxin domain-containing protein n=1 Tax=Pseudomonas straminea TaxID=47882 RepID=A0A1I1T9I3_PSEOC|nr:MULTISPECIES: hypothetical protein [Pseudomonas]TWE09810.1 putative protein-disulfide isomerase [Pseudomonas sp. AG1028]GLX12910.1 DsbA family protein [Pseudomonas straminea]SFD55294.1 putative protein-disulfide isomerase [Pseudomonas straminea]
MASFNFQYIFDPLCGWCYASSQALATLAERWPDQLDMLPSGLFSGAGARTMSAGWAAHAWSNDQRIEAATGEVFSTTYRDKILADTTTAFDSTAINRALTAARQIHPTMEPRLLRHLQLARYVRGENTARAEVVACLTTQILAEAGHLRDSEELARQLTSDHQLAQQTDVRVQSAQVLMSRFGIQGVPQLLVRVDKRTHLLSTKALYQGPSFLLDELRALLGSDVV